MVADGKKKALVRVTATLKARDSRITLVLPDRASSDSASKLPLLFGDTSARAVLDALLKVRCLWVRLRPGAGWGL